MRSTRVPARPYIAGLLAVVAMAGAPGCRTAVSPYSHTAYLQATSLKARSLRLMDRAARPVADAARDIAGLREDLDAAFEYARGRPRNGFSTAQWEKLLAPDGHLLGGFLVRWETDGVLGPTFIAEAKRLVAEAFDTISGLESGKVGAPPS